MSTDENKAVVRRCWDAFSRQDPVGIRATTSPEVAERWIKAAMQNKTWGDHTVEITEIMAEGDKVFALLTTRGKHIGEWNGLPATGKRWTNRVMLFCRVVDGKIVEPVLIADLHNQAKELGAVIRAVPQ